MTSVVNPWSGTNVATARQYIGLRLPLPCGQCGTTVHRGDEFNVGHREPRWKRPDLILVPSNWQAEHRACSDRTGQANVIAKARAEGARGIVDAPRPRFSGATPSFGTPAADHLSAREPEFVPDWGDLVDSMPWLSGFLEIPSDAVAPRFMTGAHAAGVGSFGAEFCLWADANPGLHPRRTDGLRWWQRLLAYRLLEHDEAGELVWRNALVTLSRQSGKSWIVRALICWRLEQRHRFGDELQTVIHVAHKLPTAIEVWRPAARWALEQGWKVRWANGEQQIESPDGGRWMIAAAVDGVGVGFALSMLVVDEGWQVKRAVVEAADPALTESSSPQLLLVSTAGDSASDLFGVYRQQALDTLLEPSNVLLLEWSAPPDAEIGDREAWRAASPVWSPRREGEVLDKLAKLEPLEFEQSFLNRWVDVAHGRSERGVPVFTIDEWEGLSRPGLPTGVPAVVALESWFSAGVCMASAWSTEGGVLVNVVSYADLASAGEAAVAAGAPELLVGKSMCADPVFVNVAVQAVGSTTTQSVTDLRRFADEGVLFHDGSPELAAQLLGVRTVPAANGPRVCSTGRADAVKAAAWAVARVRRLPEPPRIF